MVDDEPAHPAVDTRFGEHQRAGMPDDAHRGRAVVFLGPLPAGRVHREFMFARRDQPKGELLQIGLNAPTTRRKVIGNQKDPCHRRSRYPVNHCAHRVCNVAMSTPRASPTALEKSPCPGPQAAT